MTLEQSDFEHLLELRTSLRRFLHWSGRQARAAGLTPAKHQLLLAVRGHPNPAGPTIGEVADYLRVAPPQRRRTDRPRGQRRAGKRIQIRAPRASCALRSPRTGSDKLDQLAEASLEELAHLGPAMRTLGKRSNKPTATHRTQPHDAPLKRPQLDRALASTVTYRPPKSLASGSTATLPATIPSLRFVAPSEDECSRFEILAAARDRVVERLDRHRFELPHDVVAPVEAAEHVVEPVESADPLLGATILKHCFQRAMITPERLAARGRRASPLPTVSRGGRRPQQPGLPGTHPRTRRTAVLSSSRNRRPRGCTPLLAIRCHGQADRRTRVSTLTRSAFDEAAARSLSRPPTRARSPGSTAPARGRRPGRA